MNKKAQAAIAGTVFWGVATLICSTAFIPSVTNNFRERKGVEFCMERENLSKGDCEEAVKTMPKDVLLAYIKDDNIPEKPLMNFGNIN